MGQFYKTTKPEFSDDFVYTPPWEILNKVAATKQAKFDATVTEATALNDLLKIKHIDDEVENEKVATEKDYYESEVQGLTQELQAGGDYTKMMPRIRELQKKIMQSKEDGNIAKFEQSAAIQQRHMKAIQDAKKQKDGKGDVLGAQAGYNTFMKSWKGQDNRSLDDTLAYEELINQPEALNWEKMVGDINKLKYDGKEVIRANPDGKGYIITKEGEKQGVDESRIRELVMGKIKQDPNIVRYYEQRDRFGLAPGVYNKDTKRLNIVENYEDVLNKKGEVVGKNPSYYDNELTSYLTGFDPYAYERTKNSRKLSSDSTAIARMKEANKDRRRGEDKEEREAVTSIEVTNKVGQGADTNSMFTQAIKSNVRSTRFDAGEEAKFNSIWNRVSKNAGATIKEQMPQLKENMMNGNVQNIKQARAFLFNDKYETYEDFQNYIGFNKEEVMQTLVEESNKQFTDGKNTDPKYIAYLQKQRDIYVKQHYNSLENRIKDVYGSYSNGKDVIASSLTNTRDISKVPGFQKYDEKFEQIETDLESFQDNYDNSMKGTYTTDVVTNMTMFPLKGNTSKINTKVEAVSNAALSQMRSNPQDLVLYEDGMPVKDEDKLTKVLEASTYVSGYGGTTGDLVGTFKIGYKDDEGVTREYLLGTNSTNPTYHAITKMVEENLLKPGDALYKQYGNVEFTELEKRMKKQQTSAGSATESAPVRENISGSNLFISPNAMSSDEDNEQTYSLVGTNKLTGGVQPITQLNIGGNNVSLEKLRQSNPEIIKQLSQPRSLRGVYNLLASLRQVTATTK